MPLGATTPFITPLPEAAFDLPPAVAAVDVTPAAGTYPHRAVAGQPFKIGVRAYPPKGTPPLQGSLRWRKVLSPRWEELPLESLSADALEVNWTPPGRGDYEWCVELWAGEDTVERHGSSGADLLQLLRVDRAGITDARWSAAPRAPLDELADMLEAEAEVLLLAPIFPRDANGLVGCDGAGHYTIDPELGDTRAFGELAAAARHAGVSLALTVPLQCSPGHPLRRKFPDVFGDRPVPDFAGDDWRALWSAWEAVFRFWLVQGIDIFHIPDPGDAPVSFWRSLLDTLRDDFPDTTFTAAEDDLNTFGEHLSGAGFVIAPTASANAPMAHARRTETPQIPELEAPPEASVLEEELPPLIGEQDFPAGETCCACSCSNGALEVRLAHRGDGHVLSVVNNDPSRAQSGHIHIDGEALDLTEHDRYYMRDLADGRAYRWSGTTNFLALAVGESAKTFRLERN